MKIIGITGGVGCGKSSVLEYINKNYHCIVLYADMIANQLKEKGNCCYQPLIDLLGKQILNESGEIDNKIMSSIVFSDESLRKKVNRIVHPCVKAYIQAQIERYQKSGGYEWLFIEAALLLEDNYDEIVDEVWYIYSDEEKRRERLKCSRHYSDKKISDIMDSQLPESVFIQKADKIIDNNGFYQNTYDRIDELMEERHV